MGSKGAMAASYAQAPVASLVNSLEPTLTEQVRMGLIDEVGPEIYECWFSAVEVEGIDAGGLTASVPVRYLKNWIEYKYMPSLLRAAKRSNASVEWVEIIVRKPVADRLRT